MAQVTLELRRVLDGDTVPDSLTESDLLVVQLPDGDQPLLQICKALLGAEISIHYGYPLMVGHDGRAALALHVEDIETAAAHLQQRGFTLLSENDLNEGEPT